ncbi:MAG: hypothetical protein A2Z35_01780 [Actinobacteria bacterium RBG_19FT_COMBO_36_27]|nr:MAG: hypothetical protein A2Z35_01780 [Actinobacteria bacterium RBG_19FT_COMBO_36_27]OGD34984.1 MAG: hypothetical protein A2V94_01560 [Candidatus Atribacteria bacterium RBG_16_35_8]
MGKAKLRGKEKVKIQFLLTASALNLKKMVKCLEIYDLKYSFGKMKSRIIEFIQNFFSEVLSKLVV